MPIYDFDCASCGHTFEELILGSEATECPECASTKVKKRISSFSIGTPAYLRGTVPMPDSPASGFAPGSCDNAGGPGTCASQ